MQLRIHKKWIAGGLVFLLVWLFPLSAFCQKASIKDVNGEGDE